MESKVEWSFGCGDEGVEELLGVREVRGFEEGCWDILLGFPGEL